VNTEIIPKNEGKNWRKRRFMTLFTSNFKYLEVGPTRNKKNVAREQKQKIEGRKWIGNI